jgi:hypothetical protein
MLPQLAPQSIPTASLHHSVLANHCSASTATCKTLVSAQAVVASTCIKPLTSGQQCYNDAAVPTSLHTNTPTLAPRAVSHAHLATDTHTSMHEKHTMSTSSAYCAPCAHWPCCSLCTPTPALLHRQLVHHPCSLRTHLVHKEHTINTLGAYCVPLMHTGCLFHRTCSCPLQPTIPIPVQKPSKNLWVFLYPC